MTDATYDLGMIGLGVMGSNLTLNMAEHGFRVIGYDTEKARVAALNAQAHDDSIRAVERLEDFVGVLKSPRTVMLLVPVRTSGRFRHPCAASSPLRRRHHHRWRQLALYGYRPAAAHPGGKRHQAVGRGDIRRCGGGTARRQHHARWSARCL